MDSRSALAVAMSASFASIAHSGMLAGGAARRHRTCARLSAGSSGGGLPMRGMQRRRQRSREEGKVPAGSPHQGEEERRTQRQQREDSLRMERNNVNALLAPTSLPRVRGGAEMEEGPAGMGRTPPQLIAALRDAQEYREKGKEGTEAGVAEKREDREQGARRVTYGAFLESDSGSDGE